MKVQLVTEEAPAGEGLSSGLNPWSASKVSLQPSSEGNKQRRSSTGENANSATETTLFCGCLLFFFFTLVTSSNNFLSEPEL